jgi:hypothetical protein
MKKFKFLGWAGSKMIYGDKLFWYFLWWILIADGYLVKKAIELTLVISPKKSDCLKTGEIQKAYL